MLGLFFLGQQSQDGLVARRPGSLPGHRYTNRNYAPDQAVGGVCRVDLSRLDSSIKVTSDTYGGLLPEVESDTTAAAELALAKNNISAVV